MRTLLLVLCCCFFSSLYAQFKEPKFGSVGVAELSAKRYEKDTAAAALLLFDSGNTEFNLTNDRAFQFKFERHYCIRIYKKSAFDLATLKLPLYEGNSSKEKLTDFKAVTYNLVDGKVVKTKLDKDNIFQETSKNFVIMKCAFPDVKEGSVIECSYAITSDFLYNLRGWTFQHRYPALCSQYIVSIPEYFEYHISAKGYLPFDIRREEQGNTNFSLHFEAQDNGVNQFGQNSRIPGHNENLQARTKKYIFMMKDVPAFIQEPDIDCDDNYIQSIEFELSSIQYPNEVRKNYTENWESVNRKLNEDEDFGRLLSGGGFIRDTVESLCKRKESGYEKASSIYSYIQNNLKWNGRCSLYALRGLKKPFQEKAGSSSEINLLLTLMLRIAGLTANPVLFSTRSNGSSFMYSPTISKFNSVLAKLDLDDTTYLLDATNKYCPMGVLPSNNINGQGRVITSESGEWANLDATAKYQEFKSYILTLHSDGKLTGSINGKYDGYAGILYRQSLDQEKTLDDYFRKMQENRKGLSIINFNVTGRSEINSQLNDSLQVEINDAAEVIGDKILLHPLLFETVEKNKYTLEERKYPVNYNYPLAETYYFEYTLPEGYRVESLPASTLLRLPDNSINLSYSSQTLGNKIIIVYKRNINKILFTAEEYPNLKEMYNQIVKKHSEQIILKKTR
jgi:hypothetical protein